MQKPLNTHRIALFSLWQRLVLNSKAGLLAGLTLLLLTGLANPAKAGSGFYKDYVVLNGRYYYTLKDNDQNNSSFTSIGNLASGNGDGSFDRGSGSILLGAQANTFNDNGDDIQATQLLYRVYRQGATPGTFVPLTLNYRFTNVDGNPNNKQWENTNSQTNLLTSTNGPGRYVLEVYFQGQGTYNNSGGSGTFKIDDSQSGANYKITFDVSGSVPVRWTGNVDDNWYNGANWSPTNQVPTLTTDATIPYVLGGRTPTITGGQAQVRTLRIEGNNGATGARNFLQGGELQVFGDFIDENDGFSQTGGLFTLAGKTQRVDGGRFFKYRVQGGGIKTLTRRLVIFTQLTFADLGPDQGSVISTLALATNTTDFGVDLGATGQIAGESETNYVEGLLVSTRIIGQNQTESFGNVGIDLTAANGAPGETTVIRRTGFSYTGIGTSRSAQRSFAFVVPGNPTNLNFTLVFHYLDRELINKGLEDKLLLFRSLNGGIPFENLKKTSFDLANNTLTRTFIQGALAATFTLGDNVTPLPVTITSFTAAAQGNDAVLNWATATEVNSQGFEVQVSSDGTTFRKLGFVASASANSSVAHSYQFRDAETGKQGTRYYRLRQLDLDGKEQFIGPKSLTFVVLTTTSFRAFPNPFSSEIKLDLQAAGAGRATVSVLDGVGRRVRTWQPQLEAGASRLPLTGLQSLPRGLYVVEVRYQDGQTQRLKLVKE